MAIYEIVMVNEFGSASQFVEAENTPTIEEMTIYFKNYMAKNYLGRVAQVMEISAEQFNRWNRRDKIKLHSYTPKKVNNTSIIKVKCIDKFRDKRNRIYGYRLIDLNGKTKDMSSESLKNAISNGVINVVNLTLTKDGRLIDTTEKKSDSLKINNNTEKNSDKENKSKSDLDETYKEVANALVYLDKSLVTMGDSYEEIVDCRLYQAENEVLNSYELAENYEVEYNIGYDEALDKVLYEAYLKILNTKVLEVESIINTWKEFDSYSDFEGYVQYENVDSINKSKTFKALSLVYKYAKEKGIRQKSIKPLYDFLSRLKTVGVAAIKVGYEVGNEYYRYLDEDIFGTLSNSVFTVGHTITTDEKKNFKELKPYSYICSKDYNKLSPRPEIAISFAFKNGEAGKVICDVFLARRGYIAESVCSIIGYIKTSDSIELDINNKDNAKIIADYCNKADIKVQKLVEKHPSLLRILPLGEKFELAYTDKSKIV